MIYRRRWTGFLVRLAGGAAACVSTSVGHVTLLSLQVFQGNPPGIWTSRLFRLFYRCLLFAIAPSSFLCYPSWDAPICCRWRLCTHGTAYASDHIGHSWWTVIRSIPRATSGRRRARLVRYKWVAQSGIVSVRVGLPRALTGESVLGHFTWTPTTCETHAAWGFAPPPHLTETLPLA